MRLSEVYYPVSRLERYFSALQKYLSILFSMKKKLEEALKLKLSARKVTIYLYFLSLLVMILHTVPLVVD